MYDSAMDLSVFEGDIEEFIRVKIDDWVNIGFWVNL